MAKKSRASQDQIEPRGLPRRVEFTATGLRLPSDLSEEEWKTTGKALSVLDRALDWAIGDWLNAGKDHGYVERGRYALALELFPGRSRKTLQNVASTARSVESSRRREDSLEFGHHANVAALPPDHQSRWLERAVDEHMTVRDLRLAIAAERLPGLTDPDAVPDEPADRDIDVQPGDLYALGLHRVLCGEAMDSADYMCGLDPI